MTKPPKTGEVTKRKISPYQRRMEITRATRHLEYVVALAKPGDVDPDALVEASKCLQQLQARDAVAAAMLTNMPGEAALILWNRARRALHSLAPVVSMRLAGKMDSAGAPGDTRVLLEVAKGIGLLSQAAPMDEGERGSAITRKDVGDIPTAELRRRLLEGV